MAYDIEGFVTRQFEDYRYYGNPVTDIQICCPFCGGRGNAEDTNFHLHIHLNSAQPVVHCFRCGYAHNWIHFVIDITGLSYWRAIGELYAKPRIRDIKGRVSELHAEDVKTFAKESSLPEDFQLLHKSDVRTSHLAMKAQQYMHRRGFAETVWKRYKLGISDSMGYRIIIPIENGYWQGRALYKWIKPKYINPKNPASDILFNARAMEMYDEVVICEGAFSAMAVGDNAMALISKEPTKERLERILKSTVSTFIIALEPAAYGTMQKLTNALSRDGRRVVVWKYLTGDPADGSKFVEFEYDLKSKISLLLDA